MSTQLEKNDVLLNLLVKMAEANVTMSVTLNVNGIVITGNLVSQKRYYEEVISDLRKPFNSTFKEEASGILDSLSMLGDLPNGSSSEEDESAGYEFVHLSGARYFIGDSSIPVGGVPWRGKMAAIDGFTLGRMS
ncbi:gas vesicle accessory protein GvpU [Cobetia sp. SIMBA_158]|uniref:gas vesicle accessory protein GvpU n=2 Tax=Pseudomonadati TaxID=3379134 RepID=UPI00397FCFD8